MQQLDLSLIPTTQKEYKKSFRDLLTTIQHEQQVSMLGMFFSNNKHALEDEDLCSHTLIKDISQIIKETIRFEKVRPQLYKDIETSLKRNDMKEAIKIKKRMARYSGELYGKLDGLRPQFIELFNRIHILMKIIYAYENDIMATEISTLRLTMPQLIKETFGLTRPEKDELHNFNSIRNLLSHQGVIIFLSSIEWGVMLKNMENIDKLTSRLIKDHKEELFAIRGENAIMTVLAVAEEDNKNKEMYLS